MSHNIKLVRVDNRLLHATISLNWNRFVAANHVITIEMKKETDSFIEHVMRLSLPKNTRLSMCTPSEFIALLFAEETKGDNVIAVFKDFETLEATVEEGFFYPEIQIPYPASTIVQKNFLQYFPVHDVESIRRLQAKHMAFYFQTSPMDSKFYIGKKKEKE